MPDLTLDEAEALLRQDGRFTWLLSGRQAWSVYNVAREYEGATGVTVSHDTVMRWFKRLPDSGAENYGGTIGWRARRDALVLFFAAGQHLRRTDAADMAG
jgi:hypothetical protein